MLKRSVGYFFILIIIFSSCKGDRPDQILLNGIRLKEIKKIEFGNRIGDTVLSKFIKPINVINILAKDSLYVSNNRKILPYEHKYIFGDFQLSTLLILDSNGNEISKIGDLGSAYDQYISIEDFNIDYANNQIKVFSSDAQTLYTYTTDGKFIRKDKLDFYGSRFAVLDSEHLIFFLNQNTNKKSGKYNILVTNLNGKIIQRLFPISKLPHLMVAYSGFIQNNDSSILYSEPFSDSIYEIKNNTYGVKYYLPFREKVFKTTKDMSLEAIQEGTTKYSWIAGPIYESNEYIYLRYKEGKKILSTTVNKLSGQAINVGVLNNKIIDNLLLNICGEKDNIFYSIIDFDMVYPILQLTHSDTLEIQKFEKKLFYKVSKDFPFKNPVIFAFKFTF